MQTSNYQTNVQVLKPNALSIETVDLSVLEFSQRRAERTAERDVHLSGGRRRGRARRARAARPAARNAHVIPRPPTQRVLRGRQHCL